MATLSLTILLAGDTCLLFHKDPLFLEFWDWSPALVFELCLHTEEHLSSQPILATSPTLLISF